MIIDVLVLLVSIATLVLVVGVYRRDRREERVRLDALLDGMALMIIAQGGVGGRGSREEFAKAAARLLKAKEE